MELQPDNIPQGYTKGIGSHFIPPTLQNSLKSFLKGHGVVKHRCTKFIV